MKIEVAFRMKGFSVKFDVGRVPCVGEIVLLPGDDARTVTEIIHYLNSDPACDVVARVLVI